MTITSPPMPPGQKQDIVAVVALLRRHKSFAMAASYDLNILLPSLATSDDVEGMVHNRGIQAVLACLINVRAATTARSTLLESATRVLCRCLTLSPRTVAPVIVRANGVALVVRALRDGDEHRPAEALQCLGMMADAGYEENIRAVQGGELLVQLLLKEEDEVRCQAMLALGNIARASLSCEAMFPEASRRALLAEAVVTSLNQGAESDDHARGDDALVVSPSIKGGTNSPSSSSSFSSSSSLQTPFLAGNSSMTSMCGKKRIPSPQQQQQQHHLYSSIASSSSFSAFSKAAVFLHAQISILLWLTTTTTDQTSRGEFINLMATAGIAPILLQYIEFYEDDGQASVLPPTLLPLCGQLLFLIVEGPLLEHAFRATALAATSNTLPSSTFLAVVSAIALCADGRWAIMEEKMDEVKEKEKEDEKQDEPNNEREEDVLDSLLRLCKVPSNDNEVFFGALLTVFRTLERLVADPSHAQELLYRKAMDAAMHVLNLSTGEEGGGEKGGEEEMVVVPRDVTAAATGLVVRLTEMTMLMSSNDDEEEERGVICSSSSSNSSSSNSSSNNNSQHPRRTSSGVGKTDTKLQALGCVLAAFARHPESQLLFGSVVDLALSSMRATRTAFLALDELCRLLVWGGSDSITKTEGGGRGEREGGLSRKQRVLLIREKVWSERGLAACLAVLRNVQNEKREARNSGSICGNDGGWNGVEEKMCRLLACVLPEPCQDRRQPVDALAFRLQSFADLGQVYEAVEGVVVNGVGEDRLKSEKATVLAFIRPVLDAQKLQEAALITRRRDLTESCVDVWLEGNEEEEREGKGVGITKIDSQELGGGAEQEQLSFSQVGLKQALPERLEIGEEGKESKHIEITSTISLLIGSSSLLLPPPATALLPENSDMTLQATAVAVIPPPFPPRAPQPQQMQRQEKDDHGEKDAFSTSRKSPPRPPSSLPSPSSLPLLPPTPSWLQVVQAQGRVHFVNTETGSAQFELPPELSAWWEVNRHRRGAVIAPAAAAGVTGVEEQEEEVLCEMPEWTVKVDPRTRMVYFVPRQGGEEGLKKECRVGRLRQYRLPADIPAGFLGQGMLQEPDVNAAAAAAAADRSDCGTDSVGEEKDKKGSLNVKSRAEEQEEEKEEAEACALLQELRQLLEDMAKEAACLASETKPDSSVALSWTYAALLRRIKKRPRASPTTTSSSSNGKELEEGLCDALRKALEGMEDASSQLSFYKDLYEREKAAHERKGDIAELEATMALVKGEVLQHTPEELPLIAKILAQIERNPKEGPELLLKEAHLLIKRIVLRVGGEQKSDTIWSLTLPALDSIPDMYMQQLRDQLRVLVIAYDNLTPQQKTRLKTASEIVKNRSWLVQLAVRCIEHGQASANQRFKTALNVRFSSPTTSLSTTSSKSDRNINNSSRSSSISSRSRSSSRSSSCNSSSSSSSTGSGAWTRRAQTVSPRGLFQSPASAKSSNTTTTSPVLATSTCMSSPVFRLTSTDRLVTREQPSLFPSTTAKHPRTTTTVAITTPSVSSTTNTKRSFGATPERPLSSSSKAGKSPSPETAVITTLPPATGAALKKA